MNHRRRKQKPFINQCDRCFSTTPEILKWKADDFKQCYVGCNITAVHKHKLCKKCVMKSNLEQSNKKICK